MTTVKPDIPALLPCPFCGDSALITSAHTMFRAGCAECDCQLQTWHGDKADATTAWNTRSGTALEIGRAMGMARAAEMHDEWAAGCDKGLAYCREVFHSEGQWYEQKQYHLASAKYLREEQSALDVEGLTERITNLIDDAMDGADSAPPERSRCEYAARAVLSTLLLVKT